VEAHHVTGVGLIALGDFHKALDHLQQVISIYNSRQHASLAFMYGHDPVAVGTIQEGWALWFLGYPQRALNRCSDGMAVAQRLGHPYTSATGAAFAAWVHLFCRNPHAVEELASTILTLSTEHDFAFYRVWATIIRGWALTAAGKPLEGIAEIRAGLDAYRVIGAEVHRAAFLSWLAEAHGKVGQVEEGLGLLAQAQTLADKCHEQLWQSELYRLRGELVLKRLGFQTSTPQDEHEPEDCFRQALTIARAQNAKSLELRATISLARLLASQGKHDEARTMLAEIYSWFAEGFDTADLKDAKVLLEELGA
jgi:predicted ATPase